MTTISIRERSSGPDGVQVDVSFDHQGGYPATVIDPFDREAEDRLEWYFEKHLRFPFTEAVKAQEAAASIKTYGELLFAQVFADGEAMVQYGMARQAGINALRFEIAGSPEFHALHWEALKDPKLANPFALDAPMVRKNLQPQLVRAAVQPSPTINVLVVTARPAGNRDVGYRTISRPLVESLRDAKVPVRIDILRPGTYAALVAQLNDARDQHGVGFYHVVHFDVHGALLTYERLQRGAEANQFTYQARYGRADLAKYEGQKAFLFLEGETDGESDPVEAGELAALLLGHQVPITMLNACQSGKQVGATETSLGSRLMQAGVQVVLAMGYSVTVSAAELLMKTLYEQLFAGQELAGAIRRGRLELYNRKGRRAYFNQTIDLEDWLLPVVYQNKDAALRPRPFTPAESAAFYENKAQQYAPPQPTYGFVGRDLDVLQIERRLLRRNILLVRGMGGAGKTTLLQHLGQWWQTTGLVNRVFVFGYDQRAWTRQQILDTIAQHLLSRVDYYGTFQPMSLDGQQALLAAELRASRHLLVLDNLESITGSELAIQHTLPEAEQAALRRMLADLAGGKTLVLLGSRSGETWLAPETFGENLYDLPGLDQQAASALAQRILERHTPANAVAYSKSAELSQLMKLLDGYPLALEVVLANLARQTPAEVLAALQTGDIAIDPQASSQDKTRSILQCIAYSHSNLDSAAQQLLLCLAPFVGGIDLRFLPQYTEQLKQQEVLAALPFDTWPEVVQAALNWGLLALDAADNGFARIQPTLPFFLRSRLASADQAATRSAIDSAFYRHYEGLGGALNQAVTSKEADQRQRGLFLIEREYDNLDAALTRGLAAQDEVVDIYQSLDRYWELTQQPQRGLDAGVKTLAQLERYPQQQLAGDAGFFMLRVLGDIGRRQRVLKQFAAAEQSYQQSLRAIERLTAYDERTRKIWTATTYHELGYITQAQRQWVQAETYYQQALQICDECGDRYAQAKTYHNLGAVAQGQRQWAQAEGYYQQALQIYVESGDLYEQAATYHQLGVMAQEQRQWAQAEGYYQQALQIYVAYDARYEQASTYHQLGRVAQAQRQWAQAEGYYQQALQIKIEHNARYEQASTYHQLGRVAQAQRQWAQARQYLLTGLELFHEFKDTHSLASRYAALRPSNVTAATPRLPQRLPRYLAAARHSSRRGARWRGSDKVTR